MTRNAIVERIREAMRAVVPKCRTILYGSEARGEATSGSDIDLLILVDGNTLTIEDEMKITEPLYSIEIESGVRISPLIMLRNKWDNRPFNTPFYLNVQRDGIEL